MGGRDAWRLIYYYADTYLKKPNLEGYWDSPLGYKFFMYCTKTAE